MISKPVELRVRHWLLAAATIASLGVHPGAVAAERLRLVAEAGSPDGVVEPTVMRPVDVYLVAERDSTHQEISAVAYTLDVPEGLLVVGEELLVESLLGLGSSTTGMNLVFRCVQEPSARVVRFRVVATRALRDAVLALRPETRTQFLGLIACRDEDFAKFACPTDSLRFTTR